MSVTAKDGGPAFGGSYDTVWVNTADPSANGKIEVRSRGMSLRDYFAGQALANSTLMTFEGWEVGNEFDAARVAYVIADAMIAARGQ